MSKALLAMLLAIAVLVFGGGVWFWIWTYHNGPWFAIPTAAGGLLMYFTLRRLV